MLRPIHERNAAIERLDAIEEFGEDAVVTRTCLAAPRL